MKRFGSLMPSIASVQNVSAAYFNASRGRKRTEAVIAFETRLDRNLSELVLELDTGTWIPGTYSKFVVFDPKVRVIHAAPFRDRVVHHALLNVAGPCFESGAIANSFACRKNRGNLAAVLHAQKLTKQYKYFLKLDVKRYFDSIDHSVLDELFRRRFKDGKFLEVLERILDSYQTSDGKGIPIGTLTSQYFANFYLDGLDHLIVETFKCPAYVRYMDDFVLWHNDESVLHDLLTKIELWLFEHRTLHLRGVPVPARTSSGVPFLGYRLARRGILLGVRARRRFVARLHRNEKEFLAGMLSSRDLQRRTDALLSFTEVANCREWRRKVVSGKNATIQN